MEVYALIGSAGTGKSHHAQDIASEYRIEYLIDDGLLIHAGKKLAGISAKSESTMVAAVKRAIFLDSEHARQVRKILAKEEPKKILILGTSEHMIDRIVNALGLPPIKQLIFITDILSNEELAVARKMRQEGKHVIPLPEIEVKKDLPSYWIDPLMGFFKRKGKKPENKSIVRPAFSHFGKVIVNNQVVVQLVEHIATRFSVLQKGAKVSVKIDAMGVNIFCETKVKYGTPIQSSIMLFQEQVVEEIEYYTGLSVITIDVRITGIFEDIS